MLSIARTGALARAVLGILLLALFVGACSAGAGAALAPAGATGAPGAFVPGATSGAGPGSGNEKPGENNGNGNSAGGDEVEFTAGQEGLLIIKNGSVSLQVADIDAALGAASQQINALGGYAGGSERSGDDDQAYATVTFRIPAARWDEALIGLRGLAEKVLTERYSTDDVTGQVVDLAARIKNLQTTEAAFQAIMDRAVDIDDVLKVQAELTKVRGEIEQLAGQKTSLEAQAAFSTLAVTFALKAPDPIVVSQEQFDPAVEANQASATLLGVLQGLATAGIWFGIVWLPILLFLGLLALIGVFVYRRLRRATPSAGPPLPSPEAGA
jgi:hypothetical protein